jgi:hypothetical protein
MKFKMYGSMEGAVSDGLQLMKVGVVRRSDMPKNVKELHSWFGQLSGDRIGSVIKPLEGNTLQISFGGERYLHRMEVKDLVFVVPDRPMFKTLRYTIATVSDLKRFYDQLKLEGATEDTEVGGRYELAVSLPLVEPELEPEDD